MRTGLVNRAAAIVVAAVFIGLVVLALFVGGGSPQQIESAEYDGDGGRLALYLLLEELGYDPEVWKEAPGLLPAGEHILWAARVPTSLQERFAGGVDELLAEMEEARAEERKHSAEEDQEARDAQGLDEEPDERSAEESGDESGEESGSEAPAAPDPLSENPSDPERIPFVLHDLERYADFIREGGTLILPAGKETNRFLTRTLALEELEGVGEQGDASRPETLIMAGGEELRFADRVSLLEPDPEAWTEELVLAPDGELFALAVPVGAGRVVLLADDQFVTNPRKQGLRAVEQRGIAEADHGLLAVRLIEELDRGGRLMFDEYALGRWVPDSAVGLASSGPRGILTLQLLLFLGVLAWGAAWVREFPRDPERLSRLSPLSRARAHASLLERAGRVDVLAGMLRRGWLRRLCTLVRIRGRGAGEPPLGPDPKREARDAWKSWAEAQLERVLNVAGETSARDEYGRALFGAVPGTEAELETLAGTLDRLEARLRASLGDAAAGGTSGGTAVSGRVSPSVPADGTNRRREN